MESSSAGNAVRPQGPVGSSPAPSASYWLDTGWGCGLIRCNEHGVITDGAPIFRKLIGQALAHVLLNGRRYKSEALSVDP